MLYNYYDSYGYKETESYVPLQQQKKFKYGEVKKAETSVLDGDSFYTENGQPLTDLVEVKF